MRISDWSSDVCSSDLSHLALELAGRESRRPPRYQEEGFPARTGLRVGDGQHDGQTGTGPVGDELLFSIEHPATFGTRRPAGNGGKIKSEEHTSELQSLMRISYAVFCLKKKKKKYKT